MKKLENKKTKIALLGLGLENQSLLSLLDKNNAPVEITICDRRDKKSLPTHKTSHLKVVYRLGEDFNRQLEDFDLLFRSPGWPINCPGIQTALKVGKTKLSSPLNLFFSLCPSKNIIGVTGTKGKGTTASLIYSILKADSRRSTRQAFLGGNIGIAPLSFLNKIKSQDYIILEMSSFQLEDLKVSPRLSVITNLFKEHLAPADPNNPNYHSSLSTYWQAKLNIARSSENKFLIINKGLRTKIEKTSPALPGKIVFFQESDLPSKLVGTYNRENIAAAVTVANILKIKPAVYEAVIKKFGNLEHRLELVKEENGIKYFDNSFSTTPESTVLDLQSFSGQIIQIAGGADKGADFKPLAKTIKTRTSELILLPGQGSDNLNKELQKINFPKNKLHLAKDMARAVELANQFAKPGATVLLSTGCASFGIFKNYKERGDLFKKYVQQAK